MKNVKSRQLERFRTFVRFSSYSLAYPPTPTPFSSSQNISKLRRDDYLLKCKFYGVMQQQVRIKSRLQFSFVNKRQKLQLFLILETTCASFSWLFLLFRSQITTLAAAHIERRILLISRCASCLFVQPYGFGFSGGPSRSRFDVIRVSVNGEKCGGNESLVQFSCRLMKQWWWASVNYFWIRCFIYKRTCKQHLRVILKLNWIKFSKFHKMQRLLIDSKRSRRELSMMFIESGESMFDISIDRKTYERFV